MQTLLLLWRVLRTSIQINVLANNEGMSVCLGLESSSTTALSMPTITNKCNVGSRRLGNIESRGCVTNVSSNESAKKGRSLGSANKRLCSISGIQTEGGIVTAKAECAQLIKHVYLGKWCSGHEKIRHIFLDYVLCHDES